MGIENLSTLNAILNAVSALFLILGYRKIKAGDKKNHKKFMITALVCSALFLISYTIYHYSVQSVPYPHHDWTRPLYFIILVPHIILAAVNMPFILLLVIFAFQEKFDRHKKLAKFVWPIWIYVSVTGVIIYYMLYLM